MDTVYNCYSCHTSPTLPELAPVPKAAERECQVFTLSSGLQTSAHTPPPFTHLPGLTRPGLGRSPTTKQLCDIAPVPHLQTGNM